MNRKNFLKKILLFLFFLLFAFGGNAYAGQLRFDGHILDAAGVLKPYDKKDINSFLTDLTHRTAGNENVLVITLQNADDRMVSTFVANMAYMYSKFQKIGYANLKTIVFIINEPDYFIFDTVSNKIIESGFSNLNPRIRHEFIYNTKKNRPSLGVLVGTYFYAKDIACGKKFYAPLRVKLYAMPPFGYLIFIVIFLYFWFYCINPKNRSGSLSDYSGFMQPYIFKGIKKNAGYDKNIVKLRRLADLKRKREGK